MGLNSSVFEKYLKLYFRQYHPILKFGLRHCKSLEMTISFLNKPIIYLALGHLEYVEGFIGKKTDQLSPPFPHLAQGAINNVGYELLIFLATHLKIGSIGAVKGTVSVPLTSWLLTLIEPASLPVSL